jgi:hypothetical protein
MTRVGPREPRMESTPLVSVTSISLCSLSTTSTPLVARHFDAAVLLLLHFFHQNKADGQG